LRIRYSGYKVFVFFNHDWYIYNNETLCKLELEDIGVNMLIHEFIILNGFNLFGSPHQPEFNNWAYNVTESNRERLWNNIPKCDILITHSPPYGILDQLFDTKEHVGCKPTMNYVSRVKPKVHMFGHVHEAKGTSISNDTTFYNVCLIDEDYKLLNVPYTIINI